MPEPLPELEPELPLADPEAAPALLPDAELEPEPEALPELDPEPTESPELEPEPLPAEPDAEPVVEPELELEPEVLPVCALALPSPGLDPCVEAQAASSTRMARAELLSEGLFILFYCYAFLGKKLSTHTAKRTTTFPLARPLSRYAIAPAIRSKSNTRSKTTSSDPRAISAAKCSRSAPLGCMNK